LPPKTRQISALMQGILLKSKMKIRQMTVLWLFLNFAKLARKKLVKSKRFVMEITENHQ
jgi:hypothetical protein